MQTLLQVRSGHIPLDRLPDLRLADDSALPLRPANFVSGLEVMPVVFTTTHDRGRVFYSSLGHTADELAGGPVREILRRGLIWAAR